MDGEVRLRNCVAERERGRGVLFFEGSAMNSDVEMEDRLTLKPPPRRRFWAISPSVVFFRGRRRVVLASIDRLCITTLVESIQPKDRRPSVGMKCHTSLSEALCILDVLALPSSVLAQFLLCRQKRVGGHAPVDPFFFFLFC